MKKPHKIKRDCFTYDNITLAQFETEIIDTYASEFRHDPETKQATITKRKYSEEGQKMTLYYFNGYHIGTHQKREGWLREDIEQVKADAAKQDEQLTFIKNQ